MKTATSQSSLQPNERFGSFLIEAVVEEEKSGWIYKACDENLGRSVSLKILSSELTKNPAFADVLKIQMQTACSVLHPGIATLHGIGIEKGQYYIADEWCDSGYLSQQMVQGGKFTLTEALELIVQCSEALQAAAEIKMFHGNLRLNNILVYSDGSVKISEI